MTADLVGYVAGSLFASLLLTWAALLCLRVFLQKYLAVLLSCLIVLLARSSVYQGGFEDGIALYALPQGLCLILLSLNELRRARKQAKVPAPKPTVSESMEPGQAADAAPPILAVEDGAPALPSVPPVAAGPTKSWNVFSNHWRGCYSLGVSYWVVGLLSAIPIFIITVAVVIVQLLDSIYRPSNIFWSIAFLWVSLGLITVWQYVGVWRSANRNIAARVAIGKKPIWAGIAKLTIVLGTFWSLVSVIDIAIPQFKETYRMAFQGDPRIPDYGLRIMRDGTEVEITGGIKYGLTDELLTLLKASPRIDTIHLNSTGGRLGEGLKLNEVIRDAGLTTYVSGMCASACTIAFAGGAERWIAPNAKLGFHAAAAPGFSSFDAAAANESQRALLVRSGFDKAFIDKALATSNSDLWTPDLKELRDAKVVTDVSDGSQFAASGFGAKASKEAFASDMVNESAVLAWQKDAQPEAFDDAVDDYYKDYLDGVTDDELMATLDYWEYRAIIRNIKASGDDDSVVDLGRLFVEELNLLRAEDAYRCARFGFKGGAVFRTQYDFDPDILDRYRDIGWRVVAEKDLRPAPDKEAVAPLIADALARMRGTYTPKQVALLGEGEPKRAEAAAYCAAAIGFYDAILEAPHAEAAALLRAHMGGELALPALVSEPPG
ncbi:hypothetical protein [Ancylobacter sp.]|uniref:COG3904 family protein n=1 Tax=Ancylobacter sp. TaxID=1872567 RepID=UPI003D0CCE5B